MKTKTWLKRLVGVALAVQAGVAWAGEGPWTLRLGASYRDFDEVTFNLKSFDFPNSGLQNNPAGPYGVQNVAVAPGFAFPDPSPVILDYVRWNGGSASGGVDSGDKFAPVIGFGYDLTQMGKIRLALVGNLQYFHLGVGGTGASATASDFGTGTVRTLVTYNGFSLEQYQHWPMNALPGTLTPGAPLVDPLHNLMPGTSFSVRNQFDMDLYVLDLGLEARTMMDKFNFTFALGPTLTITDAESSQSQQAHWLHQGPIGLGLPEGTYVSPEESDSNVDFLPGAYAALGVTFNFSESWSIGLEYRYDYVSGDAGTDQAELDLSGSSGIVRLAYRF